MSAPRRSVLLVDDVADLRMLTRMVLSTTDRYDVVAEAGDGLEAIEAAGLHQPDLVLLDAAMPRMDGLEALPGILAIAPAATVVMLSAFGTERLGDEARRLGAAGYIEKGLSPPDLVARLDEILGNQPPVPDAAPTLDADSVLDVVAHDLRTPITVIAGFVDVLDQQWDSLDDDDRRRFIRRIGAQNRLAEMLAINLLSDDRRMRRLVQQRRPIDVHDVVGRLMAGLTDIASPIPVIYDGVGRLGGVMADESALAHVLCNLVSNAARHATGTTSIEIDADRRIDEVVVSVVDHGPGIPAEMQTSVFDRHVRLGPDGLGLGLHSCALFVGALDGRIWVEDTPGGGATFCVGLPLAAESPSRPRPAADEVR